MTLYDVYFGYLVTDDTIIHINGNNWRICGHWYEDGVSYMIHKHKESKVKSLAWMDHDDDMDLYVNLEED